MSFINSGIKQIVIYLEIQKLPILWKLVPHMDFSYVSFYTTDIYLMCS